MATVLTPPSPLPQAPGRPSLFLAGSIEMGGAEDWQQRVIAALADLDLLVLNPRRPDWDASWTQRLPRRFRFGSSAAELPRHTPPSRLPGQSAGQPTPHWRAEQIRLPLLPRQRRVL